jgi:hypothetical protein
MKILIVVVLFLAKGKKVKRIENFYYFKIKQDG